MSFLFSKKGPKFEATASNDESKDFSLKTLFAPEYGLINLDLLETLGTGTFGRVRLVRSIDDKTFYALKMMKKARIVKLKQLEHIQNEVKIMSRLRCRFVPELYAVFQDDNSLYMLMDFIPGGELFSHLRRAGTFDITQSRFFSAEIACALQTIHDMKIAYRDIKPENILITRGGHIRLCDFGFAKIVEDRTYTLCGTPEYLAPETIQGNGHGIAVDWWALGILIHEMICGFPPFYGDNPFTIYRKIIQCKLDLPLSLHKNVKSIINAFVKISRGSRLGCTSGGFNSIEKHKFFKEIDWPSCRLELITPPMIPTIVTDGDTGNFDIFPPEGPEEAGHLTLDERRMFREFDVILDRPIQE